MKTYYKFILKEIKQNYKKKKKNLIHEPKCIRILSWSLLGIALVDIAFEILVLKFSYRCMVLNILFLIFLAINLNCLSCCKISLEIFKDKSSESTIPLTNPK